MSQPPWTPPAGGAPGDSDDESYRGAHSSGDDAPPPTDDVWGGPGQPGPWAPATDQPWAPDDSGPAYPVPGGTPRPVVDGPGGPGTPTPDPWATGASPTHAGAGYGPPSYADPGAPSAGPARGEPGYADRTGVASSAPDATGAYPPGPAAQPGPYGEPQPGGHPGEPQPGPYQPGPPPPAQYQPGPGPQAQPGRYPTGPYQPGPAPQVGPPPGPAQPGTPQPGTPQPGQPGEPFRAVRSDAVPPTGPDVEAAGAPPNAAPVTAPGYDTRPDPAGYDAPPPDRDLAARDLAGPAAVAPRPAPADVYTPADPPPTPRPPQPELPDSMSDVPQYAARLAPAPLPDGSAPPPNAAVDAGPAWGAPTDQRLAGPDAPAPFGAPAGSTAGGPGGAPTGWPQGPAHAAGGTPPPPAIPRPEDLLVSSRPRTLEKPATWGWRGRLNRWTGGAYKPKPSQAELADRQAKLNAQRGFSRPMTVVVIQPKGGAGKTPTTICVSSALGVRRGGYIVGWDNNETRGTLAVRTTNDDNQRTTAWDLLGRLDEFERSEARVGDLSYYMRAQGDAQFDALVSDDNPGNMAQIGEVEFKRIHQVLQRFYRMIIIDTGNNVRSTNWQAAVDHADQIVVVSTYQRDVGYSGSWVLDHLAQTGRDELARDAITVLTAAEPTVDQQVQGELVKHFQQRTRAVVEVPYDPHIAEGGPIRWAELSEGSKRAWTSVAAAITQTLYDRDQRQLSSRGRPG